MGDTSGEVLVARAVAEAVQRAGRTVVSEPRQIYGMVSDVLGAEARTRRVEIDAVVRAASEQVPERLMSRSIDAEGAVSILVASGLDDATADFAVQVWLYALGLLADESEPPTLTRSVENTGAYDVAATDMGSVAATDMGFGDTGAESVILDPAQAPPPFGVPASSDQAMTHGAELRPEGATDHDGSQRQKNRVLLLAGAGLFLVVVIAVGMLLLREKDPADASAGRVEVVQVSFETVATPVGTVDRTWRIDGKDLMGELQIENRTDSEVSGVHYEVVPKSLAKAAALIKSEPEHRVIKEDPVVAWDVSLTPKKKMTVKYRVDVGQRVDAKQLAKWKADQIKDEQAFAAESAEPPVLEITSPPGQEIPESSFTLTGKTDPTATIEIAGASPTVAEDGTWTQEVTGLAVGENTLQIVATSRYGVEKTVPYAITVVPAEEAPVEPPAAPTTTAGPGPGNESRPPNAPPPTRPAAPPPTRPAPPPPTPLSVSISGPKDWKIPPDSEYYCSYTLNVSVNVPWSSIVWSGGSYYNNKTAATFNTSGMHSGQGTITATVTSKDGQTKSASYDVNLYPGDQASC